ncbi:unnamed protein product, partial [Sphacelaria rigidula]
MAAEVRSPENCPDKKTLLKGSVESYNFSHMPRNKNDPSWTGQGGHMWVFTLVNAVLEVNDGGGAGRKSARVIPLKGKTQLSIRHVWSPDEYKRTKREAEQKKQEQLERRAMQRKSRRRAQNGELEQAGAGSGGDTTGEHSAALKPGQLSEKSKSGSKAKLKSLGARGAAKGGFWAASKRGKQGGGGRGGASSAGRGTAAPDYPGSLGGHSRASDDGEGKIDDR